MDLPASTVPIACHIGTFVLRQVEFPGCGGGFSPFTSGWSVFPFIAQKQ